jgi:cell division protein FtsW
MLAIYLAEYPKALEQGGFIPWEFRNQAVYCVLAVAFGTVASRISWRAYRKLAIPLWTLTLLSLLAVEFFGTSQNGAKRWISVGGVLVQPAEFAKFTALLYLAHVLADRPKWPRVIPRFDSFAKRADIVYTAKFRRLIPGILVLFAVFLIEHEPDLGTAAIVAVSASGLILSAGIHWKTLVYGGGLVVLLLGLAVWKQPYRLQRFEAHQKRWEAGQMDSLGFQTVRSEVAMAEGGLLGVGVGGGQVKYVMPAAHTDFVMATISEEMGLLRALAVIGVLAALALRLGVLATQAQDRFAKLLLLGVAWWIASQSATNVMMANGSLPAIGIPLPFVSYGGSSLIALWVALGATQAVWMASARKAKETEQVATDSYGWRDRRAYLPRP